MRAQLIAIALLITTCGNEQPSTRPTEEFEGIIRYSIVVTSKSKAWTSDQLQADFGKEVSLYYRKGQCRMSFTGEDLREVWYNPTNLTEHTLRKGIDTLFTGKVDMPLAELKQIEEDDGHETLLGLQCNCMNIVTDKYTRRLCYSQSMYINPDHFAKYAAANYDKYYAVAQAPFLKQEYIGEWFEYTYTAISIEPKVLDDSIFVLPDLPLTHFPGH